MENTTIQQQMPYGSMLPKKEHHVKIHGMIKNLQVNIKTIVFINQNQEYVVQYIKNNQFKKLIILLWY